MANLQDVAAAAGVSKATVSRYLNGSLDLPARTAQAIDRAIRDLDYRPNPHARRLSLGRSDTVALIVPDIASPFFATLVGAVEAEASVMGLSVALYATLNSPERELSYLDLVRTGHADGLIFVTNHPATERMAAKLNTLRRCVVVDEDVPEAAAPKLFCDNRQGGYLAGRHLAEAGHRHALFIGGVDQMISGARRWQGFVEGMDLPGLPPARIIRHCGQYTVEAGREAGRRFLDLAAPDRPTAIFATSDELLIGLCEVLTEAGLAIPHEVSIVGFDDVGPLHLFAPPVTAVRQPVRALGQRALQVLMRADGSSAGTAPTEELLPVTLIVRNSVAPPVRAFDRNTNSEE